METFKPKDLHNITTLSNAIKARTAYEDARVKGKGTERVVLSGAGRSIIADETIASVIRGLEVGARTELFEAGLHTTVHEVYRASGRKDTVSGE